MNNAIYLFDLFKQHFSLRVNKQDRTTSILGFILSLIILIFLTVYFFNSDIFHKLRPITSDQELLLKSRETLNLNQDNFGLVVGITDDLGLSYNDPSIFSLSVLQVDINITSSKYMNFDNKALHYCQESDFSNKDLNFFNGLSFNKYFCLDNSTIRLAGSWESEIINYFAIEVKLCENDDIDVEDLESKHNCKSNEEIHNFFLDKYLTVYYKESNYDLNNYLNPMQESYKNYYWTLSSTMRKQINMNIKKIEIVTDDGIIFQEANKKESFKLSEIVNDFDLNYKKQLMEVDFFSSPKKQYATRNYQKIQEVLASLGGIFSFFMTVGLVITRIQIEVNLINSVMNKLYAFQIKETIQSRDRFDSDQKISLMNQVSNQPDEKVLKTPKNINDKNDDPPIEFQKLSGLSRPPSKDLVQDSFVLHHISLDDLEAANQTKKNSPAFNQIIDKKNKNIKENQNLTKENNELNIIRFESNTNILTNKNTIELCDKNIENKQILDKFINKNEKFRFRLIEYIKLRIKTAFRAGLTHKEKLFQKTQNIFREEIDLTNILQRIHEMEKLKMLLLNERQLCMFNYLTKPLIFVDNSNNTSIQPRNSAYKLATVMRKINQKNERNENFMNYYSETQKNMKENEIDRRLIEFIDQRVANFE